MNILIIKTDALGDVVRSSFIAQALKDKYKDKNPKVFWVTQEKAKLLFVNNPYVDKIISLNYRYELKKIFFDIVINLEEDEDNCRFASSLKFKEIIGFIYKEGKILPTPSAKEWYDMSALGKKPQNDILKKKNRKTHRQILSEITGIKNYEKYEPFLRLTHRQRKLSNDFLKRHNLSRTELIIGINTGSADRWPKQLSVKKTIKLIDRLYKEFNAKILLFGGPNEIERNKEILKSVNSPVIDTGCGNNLLDFPALISVCSLFITTDSLGLNIALALKRKTICLVGPTSPAEIEMYRLGNKVIAKSSCVCCYKKKCKSMEKIDEKEVVFEVKKLLTQNITILITAFKEPRIARAIQAALNQKTRYEYEVLISAPDKETQEVVKNYSEKFKQVKLFKDPGKGKSYALNLVLSTLETDIVISTDGDVEISNNSVEDISNLFLDPEIGCVSGRPFPIESRKTKYGYWSNFLFDAAHRIRKQSFNSSSFIECSGYLFAFRKNKIKRIPVDVAEDSIIPYYLWQKGYKIGYADKAKVYVKNPSNLKDWIKQKIRTNKAHENLDKYADTKTTPRVKTFKNETKGIFWILKYPKNIKEVAWTIQLILARAYVWFKYFLDVKFLGKHYYDAWQRVESTK